MEAEITKSTTKGRCPFCGNTEGAVCPACVATRGRRNLLDLLERV